MAKTMKKMIFVFGFAVVTLTIGCFVYRKVQNQCDELTEYSSETVINKILDIEEIHMANYPYSGKTQRVIEKQKKNGKVEVKGLYHVTYKGNVQIGTTEKLKSEVNEEEKIISVFIPDPEILNLSIDFDSIDYIFIKDKYHTETISEDSYKLCLDDMRRNIELDQTLMRNAKQNTENLVLALLKPFASEYQIIVK